MTGIRRGPAGLFEMDGVWHWVGSVLQSYAETSATYLAECGAQTTMSWAHSVWSRRTWGMGYYTDPFEPRAPKPGPECGACRSAYVRQLREAADRVEAGE